MALPKAVGCKTGATVIRRTNYPSRGMGGSISLAYTAVERLEDSDMVLLIESDPAARAQMLDVLALMEVGVRQAADLREAVDSADGMLQQGMAPEAIVCRVTLPDGSGMEALDHLSSLFPDARQVMVSHFPKDLLLSLPAFANRRAEFLQAEFTDEEFRHVMRRALARGKGA